MTELRDLATRLYAALAKGDGSVLGEVLHPDFVGTTTEGLPLGLGGRYEGPDAMRDEFWWRIGRSYRAEAFPESFQLLDDGRLQVAGTYRGEGRRSGRPLEAEFVHVLSFRDGRISALTQLTDSAAWADALGDELTTIAYSVEGAVAHIELNRPEVRNAIDLQLAEDFLEVALRIQQDPRVRAVLISGEGPALSVGGDIEYFRTHDDLGALFARMTAPFHEAFRILSTIDAPIVTAAHGAVAGGGVGFVYAADIVIAAEGTRFVTAFADLGVSGDGGGTWHLPRLAGVARAKRIYLENRPFTAEEAHEWGMVSEVVPADELLDRAMALAARLAAGPTVAYAHMRALFHQSATSSLGDQLRAETEHLLVTGRTADVREAIDAFAEKRSANFQGK
ncbi:MAG TPA: enoyl-CoA hydratase-related protein [Nocardioidaceae bacterium]|nr:enoyl-CoA hydratase-related protein [Nocardioidaceae bacterium]